MQARELRAMATSLAFHQHHSLKQVMEAASWRVDSTFASFYLRDLTPAHLLELGPLTLILLVTEYSVAFIPYANDRMQMIDNSTFVMREL